jgi:1-acyl-sn-glycerol-3-phosphate acyltransferase
MVIILRSVLFLIVFNLVTVFHATLSLLVAPFLRYPQRFRFVVLLNHFVVWWFRVACGVRYEIEGLENLPKGRAFIIVCNHQSQWETFYLQTVVTPLCTVLKKELLSIPFFGWALALINPIAIDRSLKTNALKQIVSQGKERIAAGVSVLIFPEGTRVEPGSDSKFSKTGAFLAKNTGTPVVPVAHNAGERWPKRGLIKKPGVLRLVVGEAIESKNRSTDELYQISTAWIESQREVLKD